MKNETIRDQGGYVARHRYARITERKARFVADAIRGRMERTTRSRSSS